MTPRLDPNAPRFAAVAERLVAARENLDVVSLNREPFENPDGSLALFADPGLVFDAWCAAWEAEGGVVEFLSEEESLAEGGVFRRHYAVRFPGHDLAILISVIAEPV